MLRRLRTITSASRACSSSTWRGVSLSRRSTKWLWNRFAVLNRPGSSSVTRLYNSSRLFCTGVAVSSRMYCRCRAAKANFQACVFRFRRWWASSTMIMSQVRARTAERWGSRFAVWIEAITRSNDDQASAPCSRKLGSSWLVSSIENFRRISPCHCSMSDGGTSTRTERTRPRIASSERIRPASIVLPRPTSSQSKARPRKRRRTVWAVRAWYSSGSMSRTRGSAIRRSNPACKASREARSARSNSRRSAAHPAPPRTTPASPGSRVLGTPC